MSLLVEANDIRVEFGKLVAVDDVSFTMSSGDLLGLLGPNGAGKTTLLRVLAGLQAPTSGSAKIMGHDILDESHRVRGEVGFSPDSPPAYEEMTVEKFLYFVAELNGIRGTEAEERIDYWLDQVWLDDKREEKVSSLSRGMRQRITVAQTLIPSPAVVLLDEPSSGLDPAGRIQLRHVIASLAAQGKAVIVSSHILADLEEYCTHIAIIERGGILRYSHVDELAHQGTGRCNYKMNIVGEVDCTEALMAIDGVSHILKRGNEYVIQYDMGDEEAALLLRQIIDRRLGVTSFHMVRESLEEVYLKTGVRQVD
ncbi:MAG: ABC transporter ATP-binding protein [Phycisphaerae bacterium]|nr:MAG: ABC transporter ATP-binding protein [Phycisphaerae bacterium]